MTRDKLQNIFRKPFSMQIWQELLMNLFGATEVRTSPTQIESDNPTADTTALEAQIDTMVYALYNITDEEIAIITNK